MKTKWILQKDGTDISISELEKKALEIIKNSGYKKKDVANINFYFNSEEGNTYFVASHSDGTDLETGCIPYKDDIDS